MPLSIAGFAENRRTEITVLATDFHLLHRKISDFVDNLRVNDKQIIA